YAEVKENIEEIILMGGSTGRGNASVMAEFNIYADPEAAKIVFSSGLPIVMAGIDVGQKALVYPEDSAILKDMNDTGNMIYHLSKKYRGGSFNTGLKTNDGCALALLLKHDFFKRGITLRNFKSNGADQKASTLVDSKIN